MDPALRYSTVSFLSDYGRSDEFVGVVHSVLRGLAPGVEIVDITHDIPAWDVRAGGLALARAANYLVAGVVVAVVDPGVGTARRPVAVEVGDGASVLLGPDNGLLAPAVALVGGATAAVVLDNPDHQLPSAGGATFDGRDVFAPAAAALCRGVPLEEVGTSIDPAGLLPGTVPVFRTEGAAVVAEVLWVDRYGNAQLNLDPTDLVDGPLAGSDRFDVQAHGRGWVVGLTGAFAEVPAGGVGLVVDSHGLLALAADRASAAEQLGLAAGDAVTVRPLADSPGAGESAGAIEVPVAFGRRGDEQRDQEASR